MKWEDKLLGHKFTLVTDHKGLEYFETQKNLSDRQVQWWEFLSRFNYTIIVSSVKYLHMALMAIIIDRKSCIFTSYVCTCSIVAGGSFTIQTHCIAIVWESPGDSHNLLTFTVTTFILLQSTEVDFEIL